MALLAAYLLAWPTPVDPVAWSPPPPPTWRPNHQLAMAERLAAGGPGPEDVAIDREGRLYAGLADGRIVRLPGDATELGPPRVETFARTEGRPLGLAWSREGELLVCDAERGLLAVDALGTVRVLVDAYAGQPLGLANDLDVAADGTIYFSASSTKFPFSDYRLDLLEHGANGRLFAFDPSSRELRLLAEGLHFPNGVALSTDQRAVLVAETGTYRVLRFELVGPDAGRLTPFAEDLPGFPDGISRGPRGIYWLALAAPRDPAVDWLMPRPFMREVLARLPAALLPEPRPHAWLLGLDERGQVVHDLQDPGPDPFAPVTSVEQHGEHLYLGTLEAPVLGRIRAPDAFAWPIAR